jgi:hypothetical protein
MRSLSQFIADHFTLNITLWRVVGIFICGWFLSCSSFINATHQTTTTIQLEITANFTGTLIATGNSSVFQNNIYRTTGTVHTLELQCAIDAEFDLHGDIEQSLTGIYTVSDPYLTNIQLGTGDWIKEVYITYIGRGPMSGEILTPPGVKFWRDTTPPPLTFSFNWPSTEIDDDEPISFQRDAVVDAGIWVDKYIIQLSYSPIFSTAIDFTTTWTTIILWGGSMSEGDRYRRRWASDMLWNTVYGYPVAFTINSSTPPPVITDPWSISSIWTTPLPTQPSPISDQCPWGDSSWSFFDGLCTALITPPVLVQVPEDEQALHELPRRQRTFHRLNTPPERLYTFPTYDPPKPYTIYEYDTPKKTNTFYSTSRNTQPKILTETSYLYIRYTTSYPTCSTLYAYCPADPVCSYMLRWCASVYGMCSEQDTAWCPRYICHSE